MLRTIDLLMICALVAAASWTFKVKHDSELALERVAELEQRIQSEREAIDILHADWSLLTSPDRLQGLVERHAQELELVPLKPERIVTVDDIPMRVGPSAAEEKQAFSKALEADKSLVTGSVAADQTLQPADGNDRTGLPPLEPLE